MINRTNTQKFDDLQHIKCLSIFTLSDLITAAQRY